MLAGLKNVCTFKLGVGKKFGHEENPYSPGIKWSAPKISLTSSLPSLMILDKSNGKILDFQKMITSYPGINTSVFFYHWYNTQYTKGVSY